MTSKVLARNISSLYLVQIANYVIPILLLPYLTRTLGLKGYGELATLQAIASYGLVVTDYGFQLSATRRIAASSDKEEEISLIYTNVVAARFSLALISCVIMAISVYMIPYLNANLSIIGALALLVIGNSLMPLWFFQGLQRMVLVSLVILASRIIGAVLTLLLVHSYDDLPSVIWAQAVGIFLPAVFAVWKAKTMIPCSRAPSFSGVAVELKEGWYIFQTAVFSAVLTNTGVVVLGTVAGPQVAGGYAAVERIAKGAASMLSPVTQAIYPRVSASFSSHFD